MALTIAPTPALLAQCPDGELVPSTAQAGDGVGMSVAIDGDIVLVGAPTHAPSGIAFVFDRDTRREVGRLAPALPQPEMLFAIDLDLGDGRALVGAPWASQLGPQAGAAYVFDLASGQELHALTASDGAPRAWFGAAVAVDGQVGVVGAPKHGAFGAEVGAAYLFDLATGAELARLGPAAPLPAAQFGAAVDVAGNTVVVAAPDPGGVDGRVHVFDRSTGTLRYELTMPGDGGFASSIATDGVRIVVGSGWDPVGYVFDAAQGQLLARLNRTELTKSIGTVHGLDIDGPYVALGRERDEVMQSESGMVEVFDSASGALVDRVFFSDGGYGDRLGFAVALSGRHLVAGARGRHPVGSAGLFRLCRGLGTPYCGPANSNSTGQPGEIVAYGSEQVGAAELVLRGTSLPHDRLGYFLASRTQGLVANPGGSQGNLCLGGAVARYRSAVAKTGYGGVLQLAIDLDAIPTSPPSAIQPGETWNFQCWYRDKNPKKTSNFTDAVSISFK